MATDWEWIAKIRLSSKSIMAMGLKGSMGQNVKKSARNMNVYTTQELTWFDIDLDANLLSCSWF